MCITIEGLPNDARLKIILGDIGVNIFLQD